MIAPTEIPGATIISATETIYKHPHMGYVRSWDELGGTIVEVIR